MRGKTSCEFEYNDAMKTLSLGLIAAALLASCAIAADDKDGWISMFDGKTLTGWKANEKPESWTVRDGAITGDGEASHLFWMVQECENCEFKAEVQDQSRRQFRNVFPDGVRPRLSQRLRGAGQ